MSRRVWGGFTVIAVAALFFASPAFAKTGKRPLAEAFDVQKGRCLESESLVPAVARWLGQDEIDVRIRIAVAREGDAVVYGLYQDDVLVGQRTVASLPPGCSEFTTALALSIAVAIEATFFGAEQPAETPEVAPPPSPSPSPPTRRARPPKAARRAKPVGPRVLPTGEAGVLWNTLPGLRPLLNVGIDVAWSTSFETRASFITATPATSKLGSGEVETRLYAARADACAARHAGDVVFRGCVGLAWGLVESRGMGFVERRSPSQPWLALPLRAEARLRLTRDTAKVVWGVLATAELITTLRRAQIGLLSRTPDSQPGDGRTAVLTLAPVGAAASAGLFFEF